MTLYYTSLTIFGIIAYVLIVDKNVSDAIVLVFKMIPIQVQRFFWVIRFHPRNPITNFLMERKYEKMALELQKELTSPQEPVIVESDTEKQ
jgi:hypothetical protein